MIHIKLELILCYNYNGSLTLSKSGSIFVLCINRLTQKEKAIRSHCLRLQGSVREIFIHGHFFFVLLLLLFFSFSKMLKMTLLNDLFSRLRNWEWWQMKVCLNILMLLNNHCKPNIELYHWMKQSWCTLIAALRLHQRLDVRDTSDITPEVTMLQ